MISSIEQSLMYLVTSNYHQSNQRSNSLSSTSSLSSPSSTSSSSSPNNRISFAVLTVTCIFLIITSELKVVHSNPVPSPKSENGHSPSLGSNRPIKFFNEELRRECYPGSKLRDLCEMCAKVTRNTNTYPWCCTHQFNVTAWCDEYLAYTIGPNK